MKKSDFWFLSLIALFTLAVSFGWNIWLRIAVIANSVLVLLQIIARLWEAKKNHG